MLGGNFLLLGLASTWLTPLWLFGLGAVLFLVGLALVYGVLKLVAPRGAAALVDGIREGMLLPVFYLTLLLAAFSVVGLISVPFRPLLAAALRIPTAGAHTRTVEVPAATHAFEIPIDFRPSELQAFTLSSDQPLVVITHVSRGAGNDGAVKIAPEHPVDWTRIGIDEKIFPVEISTWSADNLNDSPAHLQIRTVTDIDFPEVRVVPLMALAIAGLFAIYFLIRQLAPKVSAIALVTSREVMSQPLFFVVLALGVCALFAFIVVPYFTFGEDLKMLKDSSLTLIMLLAILIAVWSASVSIAEEIESRTALTLLCKPVRRRQFILGKFLGIMQPTLLLFILLGSVLLITVSIKVVYDKREVAQPEPEWQLCFEEIIRVVPGLVLGFFEAVVLAAISVAISTRLPMVANLMICATIYVMGHLVPSIVASSVGKFEIVRFVGMFLATVFPMLDNFNIQAAVAAGTPVPGTYLWMALLYASLYSAIAMLIALAMFEDRDLA